MPLSIQLSVMLRTGRERRYLQPVPNYVLIINEELKPLSFVPSNGKYELVFHALQLGYLDEADTAFWQTRTLHSPLNIEESERLCDFTQKQLRLELDHPALSAGTQFHLLVAMHNNPHRTIDYKGCITKDGIEIEKILSPDFASR